MCVMICNVSFFQEAPSVAPDPHTLCRVSPLYSYFYFDLNYKIILYYLYTTFFPTLLQSGLKGKQHEGGNNVSLAYPQNEKKR